MFKVCQRGCYYYIDLHDVYFPLLIASLLDIDHEHYRNILINNGAFNDFGYLLFDNKCDAQNAISTLEIYLIMKKLAGE